MTNDELDKARAMEAWRQLNIKGWPTGREWSVLAARLAREGWKPVDPLLVEAREVFAAQYTQTDKDARAGKWDNDPPMRIALAALRRGIEIGKGEK